MTLAYVSGGSNLEPEKNALLAARALKARHPGARFSRCYRNKAIGFDGPDFLNAAAIVETDLDPFALTQWLHGLERDHGRIRGAVKFSDRTLDVDLVYFDDLVIETPELQLPRPELRHAFVLRPLADIAPEFVDPVRNATLRALWNAHPERDTPFDTIAL